ncbi:hypothetical protein TNCV_1881771 [Trichonephila clavipes]|nr:hypothetical protein TNCV_1881771 [Trichonephila clavipes]
MTISDGSPTFDIGPNVSQHNRAKVEQLLSTHTPKKTKTVNIELDIALTDDEPIFYKPRRLPFAERDIVDAQVDEWVKNGIVEPCSSPYASQVVVVKKKDGKSRVCIDYRRLNRKLIKDNYPLPLIDDILDCLQNAKIFTTLDLKNGFFHVAVNERSSKFTRFVTHNGQYQFRRMPFGLSTCPSNFMRYINAIFRHLISKSIVLPYMDDVVIPAANESEALEYLKIVLQDLVSKDFYIPRLKDKVEKCIQNCVTCILTNRKRGKQDGTLNPIEKNDLPLHTFHLDHLGPLATTSKKYKHVFAVIDAFSKFTWLYPTRSTDVAEVINRLENQRHVFGNPARIITDKGSAFTSSAFEDYCKKQNILHISITTGLPRLNGQIEKQNSTIIAVLSKLSVDDPEKWYSHVPHLQEILNSTFQRSIKMTPFELLFGTKMKSCQDIEIVELLNDEITAQFQEQRDALRQDAKKQIYKVQDENRRTYNLRRRQAHKYQLHDLVAIKRTQFGPGLKLKQKYLGPYKSYKSQAQ